MNRGWDLVHAAYHREHTREYAWAETIDWILVVLSMLVLAIDFSVPAGSDAAIALGRVDVVLLSLFGLTTALAIASFRPPKLEHLDGPPAWRRRVRFWSRVRYCLSPLVMLDIIVLLSLSPALRGLRALRLFRFLLHSRSSHDTNPLRSIARGLAENSWMYAWLFGLAASVVAVAGVSVFVAEHGVNDQVATVGDGVWWALVTLTTTGYGDIAPKTAVGRSIAAAVMISGMFMLALFTGAIATTLLQTILQLREEQFRMTELFDHIVVCGYDSSARPLLDEIHDDAITQHAHVLFAGTGDRPHELPARFTWVRADVTKEVELERVHAATARTFMFVGSRQTTPQQADAITLLGVFTLHSYLKRIASETRRKRPIYVVAEILDPENQEHARSAGADEVIASSRIGFSLMAQSIASRGTGQVLANLTIGNAILVWKTPAPAAARTYGEAAAQIRTAGATAFGIERRGEASPVYNPPDAEPLREGDTLLYLAREMLPAGS